MLLAAFTIIKSIFTMKIFSTAYLALISHICQEKSASMQIYSDKTTSSKSEKNKVTYYGLREAERLYQGVIDLARQDWIWERTAHIAVT